ncbi:MAG TPA: family 20 glycosylhydrolase [Propionibacteriaceae bacterium]|nr:family 20 glycosylhydrolase [Propionibacteriaceae bacterium]
MTTSAQSAAPGAEPLPARAETTATVPAFAWRGVMLDVARHFLPIEEVRRFVEAMSVLRLNVLHLHLTDDQGWRFESKTWPRLTEVGAWREETVIGRPGNYLDRTLHPENHLNSYDGVRHGGFYTQDELRELVAFARARGITVMPEIDMPGHMRAARAAYPELGYAPAELGVGRSWGIYPEVLRVDEAGLRFCTDILGEVLDVFDSPYVHIGGDECPPDEWEASPSAQAQARDLGIESVAGLQRWFTNRIGEFLASRGRRLVGWDEIIDEGVPEGDPVVVAWRSWTDAARRATEAGLDIVQAPPLLYFDYAHGTGDGEPLAIGPGATLADVYAYDPYEGVVDRALVLGLQAQLWSEYITHPDHLWYMAFPRLVAVADIGWYGAVRPSYEDFLAALPGRLEALAAFGIGHRPLS